MHSEDTAHLQTAMNEQVLNLTLGQTAPSIGGAERKEGRKGRDSSSVAFYSRLGKLGGAAVRDQYGADYYSRIGKKGGKAARDKLGLGFYQRIGQAGGCKVAEQRGPNYYKEIGRRGGQAQRRKKPGNEAGPPHSQLPDVSAAQE